jgi:hypothetical protein
LEDYRQQTMYCSSYKLLSFPRVSVTHGMRNELETSEQKEKERVKQR